MNKTAQYAVIFLLVLMLPYSAAAETDDLQAPSCSLGLTVEQLHDLWQNEGFPQDIGGVYYDSKTGKYGIELNNMAEDRIEELRALLAQPDEVDFIYTSYTFNELKAIQDEIADRDFGNGVYSAGIGWTTIDGELTGFGPSGLESRVVVGVDPEQLHEYIQKYQELYQDRVYVEAGSPVVNLAGSVAQDSQQSLWRGTLPVILTGLTTCCLLFFLKRKHTATVRTVDGTAVKSVLTLRAHEVEAMIRNASHEPSRDVWERIKKSIS